MPNGSELVYFSQDSQHYDDLWISDFTFRSPQRLTHINPALDGMSLAKPGSWNGGARRFPLQVVVASFGYEEGKRYPLLCGCTAVLQGPIASTTLALSTAL